MVKRVFLVGFMGSGKTTIGKHLAKDMKWQFIDMDDYFEKKHECKIKEFFAKYGEAQFRIAENEVVKELATQENVVVATGGGAPCYYDNMEIMNAAGATIYINVEPRDLAKRLKNAKADRPLLADKSDEELLDYITSKLNERDGHYRKAHMTVDGEHLPFGAYKTLVEMYPED